MRNKKYYIELAARWHVFLLLNVYGWGKLLGGQFYRKGQLPEHIAQVPLAEVAGFDLAWTFMGYSSFYIAFIGLSQIAGACCLIFNRTKLLGAFILLPILVNIIIFDAIFFTTYGALASASIYLILILSILFLNKKEVVSALKTLTHFNFVKPKSVVEAIKTIIIVLLLMAGVFGIEQLLIGFLGH